MEVQASAITTQTIDNNGKPPSSRIVSAFAVYSIAQNFRNDDSQNRAQQRAEVNRQLGGFKPYSASWLKETGQGDRSNIPFRGAESNLNSLVATYSNLIYDVATIAKITVKDKKLSDHSYGATISQKFHSLIFDRWKGFMDQLEVCQKQMVAHGADMVYFPTEKTFKFKALLPGNFLVDSGAPSTLDSLETLVIRSDYTPTELFWKFNATDAQIKGGITQDVKAKAAEAEGWNVDLARKLIIMANATTSMTKNDQYSNSEWESMVQQIKNGDTYAKERMGKIRVDHVFVREFNGKISWYIVPEDWPMLNSEIQGKVQRNSMQSKDFDALGFLFQKANVYDSFHQIGELFYLDVGDGSHHSVKGYGTKNYAHNMLIDRMKNETIDAVNAKNSIVVQGEMSQVRKTRLGRITILPSNVAIVPSAFNPDINASMQVTQALEVSLARNSNIMAPDISERVGPATATGEKLAVSREGKVERKDIERHYKYLDSLYQEILRRLLSQTSEYDDDIEDVRWFKKECRDSGVPEALLKTEALEIKASRAIGFGSPAQSRMVMNELLGMSAHMPEIGSTNVIRDAVIGLVGAQNAERYVPEDQTAKDPSNQQSFAVLENSILELGKRVMVGKDQMHIAHLEVHFEPVEQIAKMFVATGGIGDNPMGTHDFMMMCLEHIAQHLEVVKDDPTRKPEYQKYSAQFDQLINVFRAIGKMVAKLQQMLQAERDEQLAEMQGNNNSEVDAEMQKANLAFQLGLAKEANMQKIREEKASHGMAIKDALAANKMELEQAKAMAARTQQK
jgi:hypothetical protein